MRIANENSVDLERKQENEIPKYKYYIIPEGEKTEIQYFNGIKKNRENLNIKPLIEILIIENEIDEAGQSHPKRKIQNFKKDLNDGKFVFYPEIDKVFEFDRNEMIRNERQGAKRGKRFLEIKLSEIFGCSKTNLNFEKFKPNIRKAIKNEKEFCEELEKLKSNLGSNVGQLLSSIME